MKNLEHHFKKRTAVGEDMKIFSESEKDFSVVLDKKNIPSSARFLTYFPNCDHFL